MARSRRRSASEGAELVERYAASGVSQREFAEREGVTVSTLQYWLRKSRADDDGGEAEPERFRFVELVGEVTDATRCGVWMELGDDLRLRFESLPSPSYLARVVAALSELA